MKNLFMWPAYQSDVITNMSAFVCDLCKKKLYSKRKLEKHYETHSPTKTIQDGEQKGGSGRYYAEDAQQEAYAGNAILSSYGSGGGYGSL